MTKMSVCLKLVFVVVIVVAMTSQTTLANVSEGEIDGTNTISRGLDARNLLTSLAGNLMSRGYSTTGTGGGSQVISLNVTNLLVLVLLKALIFAAGSLGAGTWKGGLGRSNLEEKLLTDEEILLFLSYLTGAPGDNGCLQNIACQQPEQAQKYVAAGDILLKAANLLATDHDKSYDYVLRELEEASNLGAKGGDCSRFVCNSSSTSNL